MQIDFSDRRSQLVKLEAGDVVKQGDLVFLEHDPAPYLVHRILFRNYPKYRVDIIDPNDGSIRTVMVTWLSKIKL